MSNFLAACTSLDKFITLSCTCVKLPFPYEWIDNFDKLNHNILPEYFDWYSSLKMTNISEREYEETLKIWKDNKMTTFRDYLEYYNNNDIKQFVESMEYMMKFFKEYI